MKQTIKWLPILLALIFLSAGLLPGFVLASHTSHCCECAQPYGPAACPAFVALRSIFQKLAVTFVLSSSLLFALVLPGAPFGKSLFAERLHTPSLVGWSVKFSC